MGQQTSTTNFVRQKIRRRLIIIRGMLRRLVSLGIILNFIKQEVRIATSLGRSLLLMDIPWQRLSMIGLVVKIILSKLDLLLKKRLLLRKRTGLVNNFFYQRTVFFSLIYCLETLSLVLLSRHVFGKV